MFESKKLWFRIEIKSSVSVNNFLSRVSTSQPVLDFHKRLTQGDISHMNPALFNTTINNVTCILSARHSVK